MDPDRMDRDYERARRDEEQRLVQQAMLEVLVGRGKLRTIFCPVRRVSAGAQNGPAMGA